MAVRDLIPWGRSHSAVPTRMQDDGVSPLLTLHREMNRLFDDVFSRFETGMPSLLGRLPGWSSGSWPSLEITSSDTEVRVSAELPGLDEKEIEVLVDDDVLTIRGEKRSETDDPGRRFSERAYGRFERAIQLPFAVEEDKAEATYRNGVLTIVLPKSAAAQERMTRIPVNGGSATQH